MRRSPLRLLIAMVCALGISAGISNAQNIAGSINGEVSDASGAVIPNATVTAHNVDTGVDTRTTANGEGVYHIQFLPPGHYQLSVEASGFKVANVPTFTLEALQAATFNVTMQVGSASTSVNVSAAAPILNTSTITQSSTFTANTIKNLPLNGLDFSALTLYVPGSVDTAGSSGPSSFERSTYYTDTPNLNGNRAQANNYTLDGIDMNETYNNLISYSPAPEALAEVKVLTADSPTQFGNVAGGSVVSVLKSGTNQFHGSAYGYVQDYRFNANSYLNGQTVNAEGQPAPTPINPYSFAQFGGTLGGPILHNKLFFFVDYLGARWHKGGYNFASVIPDAMRHGDFSALLANGHDIQLYDPENNFAAYNNDQGIPIVNPVAKFLFA
ncbi:MAG TPA: TonB-dependent receptor, partial [Terracidiphilus sp.]